MQSEMLFHEIGWGFFFIHSFILVFSHAPENIKKNREIPTLDKQKS